MARPGVTYFDVSQAAAAIRGHGQNPTVDRVLAQLGTGSKSTLAPLVKRWKAEQGDGADTGALPDDVVAAVKALHERLQQGADDKINQAQDEYQSRMSELRAQLTEAERTIRALKTGQADLQTRLDAVQTENQDFRTNGEAARVKTVRLETLLDEAKDRLSEAQSTTKTQKQDIGAMRANLEHYQNRVAEERQQERAQFQSNQTQWESRLRDLSQQLQEAGDRNRRLDAARQHSDAELVELRAAFDDVQHDHQALQLGAARREEALKQRAAETEALRQQLATLENRCEALSKAKAELISANRLSAQEAARLHDELSAARETMARLSDENRGLTEEKAIVEGRLKEIRRAV